MYETRGNAARLPRAPPPRHEREREIHTEEHNKHNKHGGTAAA